MEPVLELGAEKSGNSGKGVDNLQTDHLQVVDPLLAESYFLSFPGLLLVLFSRDFNDGCLAPERRQS